MSGPFCCVLTHDAITVARECEPQEIYPMSRTLRSHQLVHSFPLVLTTCFVLSFGFVIALLIWS
jgi:hypothetical protein